MDLSRYLIGNSVGTQPPSRDLSRYLVGGAGADPSKDDEESRFRKWYAERAARLRIDPNPDNPEHHYDYRAAFRSGAEPDSTGHWPSQFKDADHPRRYLFLGGVLRDTETGKAVRETDANYASARARAVAAEGEPGTGMVPTRDIGQATGMEFDSPRTLGDAARRVATAALGSPAGAVTAREAVARVLLPKRLEAPVTQALFGPEKAILEAVERTTGAPVSLRTQDAAQARFINAGRSESPMADAIADTAAHALGAMADPTNLIPGGATARGARMGAEAAAAAEHAAERLAPRAVTGAEEVGAGLARGMGAAESPAPRFSVIEKPDHTFQGETLFTEPGKDYKTIVTVDNETGKEAHALLAEVTPDGFKVKNSFTDPEYRGQHVGDNSYRHAQETMGPYEGPTDYLGRQNEAGAAATASMRRRGVLPPLDEPGVVPASAVAEAAVPFDAAPPPLPASPAARNGAGAPRPPLSDEEVARALGMHLPPGSPRAVGPTTVLQSPLLPRPFQTNIAAQTGAGAEVADWLVRESDELARARGPVQTWDTTEEMALRLGTTTEDFLSRPTQFAQMSKEERLRLTMVIKGREEDIVGLKGKLASGAATDEDRMNLLRLVDEHGALLKLGAGVGSEYGRALNTLKMEARATLTEPALVKQRLYQTYRSRLNKDKPLLDALALLDTNNPNELHGFLLSVSDPPKIREYLQEMFVSGLLWNPASHIRNVLGNTANAFAENVAVPLWRAGESAVGAALGRGPRAHTFSEAAAGMAGFTEGILDGLSKGFEVVRRGYPEGASGKLMLPRSAFARSQNKLVREQVGPVITGGLRGMVAEDAVFRVMNHRAELYRRAVQKARTEGAGNVFSRAGELVANPTGDMIAGADRFELTATFNDAMSDFAKRTLQLRDAPALHGAGGFIAPFVKIADRIAARSFEYTPYGYAKAARSIDSAESATLRARAGIGSAMMLGGAALAASGRLTASAPQDAGERDAFFRAGKKPWAVAIPLSGVQLLVERGLLPEGFAAEPDDAGNVWVPFQQIQPVAMPLAVVAAAYQGWQNAKTGPDSDPSAWISSKELANSALEVGSFLLDQSFMNGPADFFSALNSRATPEVRAKAATDLVTSPIAAMAPLSGLTKAIAQAVDPRLLNIESFGDRMRSQIPGATGGMPARLDVWGEEITPTGGRLRGIAATGTPLDASREKKDPLDQELARLGMPLGFVQPTMHDPVTGKNERLSPADHRAYQQSAGRKTRELLTELFATPDYQQADAEVQRDVVEHTIGVARQYARMGLLSKRYGWAQ